MNRSETASLWADRLKRFELAQTTVAKFCQAEGVSQNSFYQWKRKLRTQKPQDAITTARFMPVAFRNTPEPNLSEPSLSERSTPTSHAKTIIELPGGIRIRVDVPMQHQAAAESPVQS